MKQVIKTIFYKYYTLERHLKLIKILGIVCIIVTIVRAIKVKEFCGITW